MQIQEHIKSEVRWNGVKCGTDCSKIQPQKGESDESKQRIREQEVEEPVYFTCGQKHLNNHVHLNWKQVKYWCWLSQQTSRIMEAVECVILSHSYVLASGAWGILLNWICIRQSAGNARQTHFHVSRRLDEHHLSANCPQYVTDCYSCWQGMKFDRIRLWLH